MNIIEIAEKEIGIFDRPSSRTSKLLIVRVKELEVENEKLKEIVNAVAHIGVDFGYGKFEIGQDEINKARLLNVCLNV